MPNKPAQFDNFEKCQMKQKASFDIQGVIQE